MSQASGDDEALSNEQNEAGEELDQRGVRNRTLRPNGMLAAEVGDSGIA